MVSPSFSLVDHADPVFVPVFENMAGIFIPAQVPAATHQRPGPASSSTIIFMFTGAAGIVAIEQIAERVFKNRVTVTNTLRLLKLSSTARQALAERKITEGHGRSLLALASPEHQESALRIMLDLELNVRQAETLFGMAGQAPELLDLKILVLNALAEGRMVIRNAKELHRILVPAVLNGTSGSVGKSIPSWS